MTCHDPHLNTPAPPLSNLSILVVDDSAACRMVCAAMARALGASVEMAETAIQALAMAEKTPYDLIIVDIGLPDSDGRVLISALRELSACQKTSLLCVSGLGGDARKSTAMISGADAFATKPFSNLGAFQTAICDALNRPDEDSNISSPSLRNFTPEALRDLDQAAIRLREAIASGDTGALRRSAHFLSGVANLVGDDHLANLCRKAEAMDKDAGALRATEKMLKQTEAVRKTLALQGCL
ncbi:MAG: response regulator [Pikeienuella sp.]